MSVIIDYLKKTEQDSPSADRPGTVPPALLRAGRNRRRGGAGLRLFYIGLIGTLCVLICLFFIPQLKPGIADVESSKSIAALSPMPAAPEKLMGSNAGERPGSVDRELSGKRIPPANRDGVINGAGIKTPVTPSHMSESSAFNATITPPSSDSRGKSQGKPLSESPTSTTLDGIPSFNFGTTSPGKTPSGIKKADSPGTIATGTIASSNKAVRPQDTTHYYQLGLLAQRKGNFREAEAFYKRVLAVDSGNLPTLTNLAATYIRHGEFREAEATVKKILSIDPENPKALVNSGMIHLKQHRYDKAEELFTRVLFSRPTNEAALINLAYLARKKDNSQLLEAYYKKIVNAHPGNTDVLLSYASLMEGQKRYSEAASLYHRCLKLKKITDDKRLSRRIKKRIGVLGRYGKP